MLRFRTQLRKALQAAALGPFGHVASSPFRHLSSILEQKSSAVVRCVRLPLCGPCEPNERSRPSLQRRHRRLGEPIGLARVFRRRILKVACKCRRGAVRSTTWRTRQPPWRRPPSTWSSQCRACTAFLACPVVLIQAAPHHSHGISLTETAVIDWSRNCGGLPLLYPVGCERTGD